MDKLINSFLMAVLLTGIFALVGDGYAMYWAGVEIKFKDKKWQALFKSLPFITIAILTVLLMRYDK
ncbi:hypothetical protein CBF94_07875 [Limosilactobacillus reuteri]|uniref:hypothetical protein n=1 Tax=Limosilactobacillus reuteri TaxID=1598 RepID=UPI000B98D317|nr:hypothetical protein [Limosilactobacillus reuteri]OYS45551.1 hypothetical protein CBF87_08525 [Limosilactobacillus reuteri]OYS52676.1 hypothetical protein CBF81_06405 [Limosilactobacillus reuteri]OYS69034.1 hypothetical protein CBF94_07875 [Limosilactobacillus reuteri]